MGKFPSALSAERVPGRLPEALVPGLAPERSPVEETRAAPEARRPGGQLRLSDVLTKPDVLEGFDTISTDIFDTLLMRRPVSERARIWRGERLFAQRLMQRGFTVEPDFLVEARLAAQRIAFRALNVGDVGEVRLRDVVGRQLRLIGLPQDLVAERLAIELEVERACLTANHRLADFLKSQRAAGRRVIAVSDTTLDTEALTALIEHFFGAGMFDAVFASASAGASKRRGDLFGKVAAATGAKVERTLHIGDDARADGRVPRAHGLTTVRVPRSGARAIGRKASGARAEIARWRRKRGRLSGVGQVDCPDARSFGRIVLGPIAAQFCTHVWLYADAAQSTGPTALLFCARGGIGIGAAFEAVGDALSLPREMTRGTALVSRLVAARTSVAVRGDAALEELEREFRGASARDVAEALGGGAYTLPDSWQAPFDSAAFYRDLDRPGARALLQDIRHQADLFGRHLDTLARGAGRIILCDTGLYGSTQRFLAEGLPDRSIETVQFARANYKGHGEEHFARVAGLAVERDLYTRFDPASSVLRYWQLLERLFEPVVPSVRLLHETPDGAITANGHGHDHASDDVSAGNPMLAGVLDYIAELPDRAAGQRIMRDAEVAWVRLDRAITRPSSAEIACAGQGARSVDFGRAHSVTVLAVSEKTGPVSRFNRVRQSLWREGAIAREFPKTRWFLHFALNSVHGVRGLYRSLRG